MDGKRSYPNIRYFKLKKELPFCEVGDIVNINDAAGRECLWLKGIEMPIHFALMCPDWFEPITEEQHIEICKKNTIEYIISKFGKTKEEAEIFLEKVII